MGGKSRKGRSINGKKGSRQWILREGRGDNKVVGHRVHGDKPSGGNGLHMMQDFT